MSSNPAASNTAPNAASSISGLSLPAALRPSADRLGWERELFFNPRLLDQERRAHAALSPGKRPMALLLAIVLGLCSTGIALADTGPAPGSSASSSSTADGLIGWWMELLGLDDPSEGDDASAESKSGNPDPAEGTD